MKDSGLWEYVIQEANNEVEDRAEIGKYGAENGNAEAVCKYGFGESTVHLFKTKYLAVLHAQMKNKDS